MNIIKDDIWKYHDESGWVVITTNGFVKKNGECVMGAGIAKQARDKFPDFAKKLGERIKKFGNKPFIWHEEKLITFPTKHSWWEESDLKLIEESALMLAEYFDKFVQDRKESSLNIFMPKPGCLNGKLNWKDVEPIIARTLGDIVTIVDLN